MSTDTIFMEDGSPTSVIDRTHCRAFVRELLTSIRERLGVIRRALIVPPDITRFYSYAGELTGMLFEELEAEADIGILPALGTHLPMTPDEIDRMYPGVPFERFRVHNWRSDVIEIGTIPAELIETISEGRLRFSVRCAINRTIVEDDWDLVISVGQLVPHELAGIANFSKNILIGLGGADFISKSHYLAAVYGTERLMGRAESPMRSLFAYIEKHFLSGLPIVYLMTVRGTEGGRPVTRGLFAGNDERAYSAGAELCREVSITRVERPAKKVVAFMDPEEYHTAWVANKAIYRTRMAIADGGELLVIAPAVKQFGEDGEIDALIRRVGYRSTDEMIRLVETDAGVAANLTAVSHIMVSSPDGRFSITYAPGRLDRRDIEAVGFEYGDPRKLMKRYDVAILADGWNTLADGEEVFFVPRPAAGLWQADVSRSHD